MKACCKLPAADILCAFFSEDVAISRLYLEERARKVQSTNAGHGPSRLVHVDSSLNWGPFQGSLKGSIRVLYKGTTIRVLSGF